MAVDSPTQTISKNSVKDAFSVVFRRHPVMPSGSFAVRLVAAMLIEREPLK